MPDCRLQCFSGAAVDIWEWISNFIPHFTGHVITVYPKKYAHGFCFAVLCCGHTLTDLPISIRLTSLALWQSDDCPSASKATLMNMDKYFIWIHYERLHNHNKAKHNKTVCIFLGIYCTFLCWDLTLTWGDQISLVQHNEYHGCWCPGPLRCQDMSIHHIDSIE